MKNIANKISLLFVCILFCTRIAVAEGYEAFDYFESFDDNSHFTTGSIVPDGWNSIGSSAATRMEAGMYTIGYSSHSGSYVLHSSDIIETDRDEVIFTPMMPLSGGKETVLSFYLYAPGGNPATAFYSYVEVKAGTAQSIESQTISLGSTSTPFSSWTEVAFMFTPETDGEYCFSISLKQSESIVRDHGVVGIDDVTISGFKPADNGMDELVPNPDNYTTAKSVPYFNTFDNYDNDYDGSSYVPFGWTSIGSSPFFTANINGLDAKTGYYYLVADESQIDNRNDRLFTPFFRLNADYEYVISYYLYMPGNSGGGVLRATDIETTIGTEQDINFHPVVALSIKDQSISEWTYQEFRFTPQTSGAYCFAFSLSSDVNYSGYVAIEDFNITSPDIVEYPVPNFAVGGNFNVINSMMVVYKDQYVNLTNLSENAEEYAWTVTFPDGNVQYSTEENPSFLLNMHGEYNIELKASNSAGSRTTYQTLSIEYIDFDYENYAIMTWNPNQDVLLERGSIPAFVTDTIEDYYYDFVTGYNRYYNKYAERFEIPDGVKLKIEILDTWLAHYRNCVSTSGYDSDKPFEIVIYGDKDGQLDEEKVFARITTTLKDAFGYSGVSGNGEGRTIDFVELLGQAVEVQGTFYVAFEFADDMVVTTEDPNVGRSYFALNTIIHNTGKATLYVKPTDVPKTSLVEADGNWHPVDSLDNAMSGVGAYFILWVSNEIIDVAINNFGEIVFALQVKNENLIISGTEANEQILIYDINGRIVASGIGEQNSSSVDISCLSNGVYIVKTNAGAAKFVK